MEMTLSGKTKDYSFVTDDNTLDVRLKKSLCGLGFIFYISGLNSGSDQGSSVVRIKTLFQGQPAQESGQIREGDIILAVNGKWVTGLSYQVNGIIVSGLSHSKVVDILRKVEGNVQLIICRDIIPRANTAPCMDGSFYMASCPRDNMAACPGSNMTSSPGSGSNLATCPEAHMGDKAELVSNPAACSLPDVQQEDLPPELTSDLVPYVEEDITPLSTPHLSPPHHPSHRLQALTEDMAGQESFNSTPFHPACCLSSKSVTNLLHEASDRNQIPANQTDGAARMTTMGRLKLMVRRRCHLPQAHL